MQKDSFVFRKEWRDAISGLPDEVRLEIYEAIIEYGTSGKESDLKPMAMLAFNFAKTTLDRDAEKYDEIRRKRSEAGKKGGAKVGNTNALKNKQNEQNKQMLTKQAKQAVNDILISSDEDNENNLIHSSLHSESEKKKKKEKFVKPTIDEIRAYCKENGYSLDAEKFWNYYESKGWIVGKTPMKSWKAACGTWNRNQFDKINSDNTQLHNNDDKHKFDGGFW